MKVKALSIFKSKLLKPCKKLVSFFRLKPKKHVYIKALKKPSKLQTSKPMSPFLSVFRSSPKKSKDIDDDIALQGLIGSPTNVHETPVFPSPLTPACVVRGDNKDASSQREVDDACKSFESYLVEMIVEEGKTKDLMDVEELLYCWKNLKSPVFVDLVCRFYGELCRDLFSSDYEEIEKSKE